MKRCEHDFVEAQKISVSLDHQWHRWQKEWEGKLSIELQERDCYVVETSIDLKLLQNLKKEMWAFKQVQ
jgi:hypothetical protein